MSDFFKELEEDIREERVMNLWRAYGNYIIGLAVAIVIGTAGYVIWQHMKHKTQLKYHVSFSQAVTLLKQGKKDEAAKAFHELAKERSGYGTLAQLYEASLLPNPEELYAKIAQQNAADPALSKLPKILMAARALDNTTALAAIEPLSASKAWAPLSLELLALANLKRGNEVEAAKLYIKMLKRPSLSPDEKARAEMMLSQLDVPASLWESETESED
jgi:hypothetical protein